MEDLNFIALCLEFNRWEAQNGSILQPGNKLDDFWMIIHHITTVAL